MKVHMELVNTNYGTNPALITGIESIVKPLIIGEDPFKIEEICKNFLLI